MGFSGNSKLMITLALMHVGAEAMFSGKRCGPAGTTPKRKFNSADIRRKYTNRQEMEECKSFVNLTKRGGGGFGKRQLKKTTNLTHDIDQNTSLYQMGNYEVIRHIKDGTPFTAILPTRYFLPEGWSKRVVRVRGSKITQIEFYNGHTKESTLKKPEGTVLGLMVLKGDDWYPDNVHSHKESDKYFLSFAPRDSLNELLESKFKGRALDASEFYWRGNPLPQRFCLDRKRSVARQEPPKGTPPLPQEGQKVMAPETSSGSTRSTSPMSAILAGIPQAALRKKREN